LNEPFGNTKLQGYRALERRIQQDNTPVFIYILLIV